MDIGGVEHTAFVVRVGVPRDHFAKGRHEVARRYSEFEKLHEALTKAWGKQAHRAPRTAHEGRGGGGVRGGVRGRTSSPPPKRPSDCHPLMPTAPHTRRSEAPWSCPSCRPSGSTGSAAP